MKPLPLILGSLALVLLALTLYLKPGWQQGETAPHQVQDQPRESNVPLVGDGGSSSTETTAEYPRVAREVGNLYVPPGATGQPRIYLYPDGLPQSRGEACGTPIPAGLKEGRYGFLEEDPEGVLVAECEPCVPIVLELRRGEPLPQIRFAMSSPAEVVVRAGEGVAIPGAQLTVAASTPLGWWTRKVLAGDDGRALVCTTADNHVLTATSGALRSRVWSGRPELSDGPIVLVIASTFSAYGRIDPAPESGGKVRVRLAQAVLKSDARSTEIDRQGNWRIDDIPWEDEEFVFRFEGRGLHADEVRLRPTSPGVDLDVRFTTAPGLRVGVLVVSEGEPVPEVTVTPIWRTLSDAFQGTSAVTDENGRATMEDVKAGTIAIVAQKDGYAETIRGPLSFDKDQDEPMIVEILPGATIYGKVTHEDEPVREFTVVGWGSTGSVVKETFQSEDGSFQLARMHAGPVKITAHSSDLPPCLPVDVQLAPGDELEVDLQLGAARALAGTVIDSLTGASLENVRVEVQLVSEAGLGMSSYGRIEQTDPSGMFAIEASIGPAIVYFKAEGYELLERVVDAGTTELGIVGLSRLQRVKVQLIGDSSVDLSAFGVSLHATTSFGPLNPDDTGLVWFEDVDPGAVGVEVYPPGGGRIDQVSFLTPGETWEFEVPVTGTQTVEVDVIPLSGGELPAGLWLMGAFGGADSRPYYSYAEVLDGHAIFDLASGTHGYLELILSTGEVLLRRSVELSDGRNYFRWEMQEPKRVRLVDQDGDPHNGAYAYFGIPNDPVNMWRGNFANADGVVSAGDFEGDSALMIITTGTFVSRSNELDFSQAENGVLEVRLDRDCSVELFISNNDGPVGGVPATLFPPELERLKQDQTSNLDGSINFQSLQSGIYRLEVGGQGWWKTERDVEAVQLASPIHIPARRLASVELSIRKDGIPVPDAQVTLTSLTEGDDVSAWVTSGRVVVSGDSSGTSGRWSIQGIPDGRYRWLIEHPAATKAGEIEVVAGSQEFVCTLD